MRRLHDILLCVLAVLLLTAATAVPLAPGAAATTGLAAVAPGSAPEGCIACHQESRTGFAPGHRFGAENCTVCHGGDPGASAADAAHAGLRRAPASLAAADAACGACHPARVEQVAAGFMATGKGMVNVTRFAFGEQPRPAGPDTSLLELGHSPADSLLRKRCASCHLDQPEVAVAPGDLGRRGGGCGACHLAGPAASGHPRLTAAVGDARCLGCHSRSGRIALSYAGIAETDDPGGRGGALQLDDGRRVELRHADAHHRAGLACIDCHTAAGLMGSAEGLDHHEQAVDIGCADCHANTSPRIRLADWPPEQAAFRERVPFSAAPGQEFLTTARAGSVLWHVRLTDAGPVLHRKLDGVPVPIPPARPETHPALAGDPDVHDRLACAACHSRWAPQCYGCHIDYDPDTPQWDHVAREQTPGRWEEERALVRNAPPPLGIGADDRVRPFVPGMILTARHPHWEQPRFRRLFAALSPHTVGPARSCRSCHASPTALGLGAGTLARIGGQWRHTPRYRALADGLPADAWTDLRGGGGTTTREGERPFTPAEMARILDAPVEPRTLAP